MAQSVPRIAGLEKSYPNLIRIPESFGVFNFVAFGKDPKIHIKGWESLIPFNVAYIHGWKIFDLKVPLTKSIVKVKNKEILFSLLDHGRTDLVLITRPSGLSMIRKMKLTGIYALESPLEITPIFLYLHKKC